MMLEYMAIGNLLGTRISVSDHCYEMVPIFPDKPKTKRRTRGRFGRLDRLNPLAYLTPYGLVVHPITYARLKAHSTQPPEVL